MLACGLTTLWSRTFLSFHRLLGEAQPDGIDGLVNGALIENNLRVQSERRGVRKNTRHYLRHRRAHTTHAGLAVMAVTARLGPARNLECQCAPFLVSDPDGFFHFGQEDFSVADISGRCGLENGIDGGIHQVLG
jgi:hypothetical protein